MSFTTVVAGLNHPSVTRVMSILFDASVKGTVLLVLPGMLTRLLRSASAAVRHLIWAGALAGMLVIPVLTVVVPHVELRALRPLSAIRLPVHNSTPVAARRMMSHGFSEREVARAVRGGVAIAPRAVVDVGPPSSRGFARLIPAIWLAASLLVLLRLMLGLVRVALWSQRAQPVSDGTWLSLVRRLGTELGIARPLTLLRSDLACVPMTWGVVYPTVLLPFDADDWTMERRTIVLLHELAHVKRLDALTQWLAQIVVAVFWFNPLVWLAARQLRIEREHACDDFVIEGGARATDYAYDLLQIARSLSGGAPPSTALAMARQSELEGRLLAILDPDTNHRNISRTRLIGATLGVLALALPLAAFTPAIESAPRPVIRRAFTSPRVPAPPISRAFVARMPSARVVWPREIVATTPPDRETLIAVAHAASKMTSDYEKAELLVSIAKYYAQDDELCAVYLDVVSSIKSDYDRGRTMMPLLKADALSIASLDAFIAAASTIHSDYERGRTITAIVTHDDLTNRQTIDLIGVATEMTSSYEKANALVSIATNQSIDDADVRRALVKGAETISSSTDYRRVVSAILK